MIRVACDCRLSCGVWGSACAKSPGDVLARNPINRGGPDFAVCALSTSASEFLERILFSGLQTRA